MKLVLVLFSSISYFCFLFVQSLFLRKQIRDYLRANRLQPDVYFRDGRLPLAMPVDIVKVGCFETAGQTTAPAVSAPVGRSSLQSLAKIQPLATTQAKGPQVPRLAAIIANCHSFTGGDHQPDFESTCYIINLVDNDNGTAKQGTIRTQLTGGHTGEITCVAFREGSLGQVCGTLEMSNSLQSSC